MKTKTIKIVLTILSVLFIIMPNSNAALQSNGQAGTTQAIDNWLLNIRKMEALGRWNRVNRKCKFFNIDANYRI